MATNYGGVILYQPTNHWALRFDVGDLLVSYNSSLHQHNFQISQAIVFRF